MPLSLQLKVCNIYIRIIITYIYIDSYIYGERDRDVNVDVDWDIDIDIDIQIQIYKGINKDNHMKSYWNVEVGCTFLPWSDLDTIYN